MNAVDTNVFVYAFDADEAVKRPKAEELLDGLAQQSGEAVLLWQVAGESLNCLRKWEFTGRMFAADEMTTMTNDDAAVLSTCLLIILVVAAIVHKLRPLQQLVVLIGALALFCEVVYPPCLESDGTTCHRWVIDDISYRVGGARYLVDVPQQALCISITIGAVIAVCCLLEWWHRTKASKPTEKRSR